MLCELNRLGLSISPDKVSRFKQSVIQNENIDEVVIPNPDSFIQYVADNTAHDICTLDGKNTRHGLRAIAIANITNQVDGSVCKGMPVPREELKHVNEVIKVKGIPIEHYVLVRVSALAALKLKPVNDLRLTLENKNGSSLALLWLGAYFFHNHRPGWSAYMESATIGTYSGKSHITFLSIVDLSPSNPTGIYSVEWNRSVILLYHVFIL